MTTRRTDLEQGDVATPTTGRPVIYARQGVISSGHYLTSMAGMRMLLSGGNAFDALVAAGFAAAVVEPIASYSLGAEGVFMLRDAREDRVLSLSGQGTAPAVATAQFFRSKGLDWIPTGPGRKDAPLSFTVPGVVDAFLCLLERFGTKTVAEVLEPAIQYAEAGIPNYEYMIERLKAPGTQEQFDTFPPGGWDVFYVDRRPPAPGSLLVQPGLARTLRRMAEASGSAPGHRLAGIRAAQEAFYRGDIARDIVAASESVGGTLALEDLAGYRATLHEPVKTTFMGYEVLGHSTWTQGLVLLQALNILEHFDLKAMGHNTAAYIHTVTEALKLAFADREAYYGDPEFAMVPIDGLLSKEYAAQRARLIDPAKASPGLPAPGDPWPYSKAPRPVTAAAMPEGSHGDDGPDGAEGTTHVAVLDRDGNMVCATISGGAFAKSVFFPQLGFALSTRSEMFNLRDGHPNVVEPGKRPRTTLVNYIVARNGVPIYTFGCPGGDAQAQANLQLMLNTFLFDMNPQEAVEAPRFATQSVTNSFFPHVYFPGRLDLEPGIDEETAQSLARLGHRINRVATCGMGATVARRDPETGVLATGADPRRACYAIGW